MSLQAGKVLEAVGFVPPRNYLQLLAAVRISVGDDKKPEFDSLNDGISESFLEATKKDPSVLRKVMAEVKEEVLEPRPVHIFQGREMGIVARIPEIGLSIRRASLEGVKFDLKDITMKTLEASRGFEGLVLDNLNDFCNANLSLRSDLTVRPSFATGRLDLIMGFVVCTYDATCIFSEIVSGASTAASIAVAAPGIANEAVAVGAHQATTAVQKQESPLKGTVGARFFVLHLVKTVAKPDELFVSNKFVVIKNNDSRLDLALAATVGQKFKRMVAGRPQRRRFLLVPDPIHDSSNFDEAVGQQQQAARLTGIGQSLGVGEFADESGLGAVILNVDRAQPLSDNERLEENQTVRETFEGSWKWVFTAPIAKLTRIFESLKRGSRVSLCGAQVLSMDPAFPVNGEELLPIVYRPKPSHQGETIPGTVVRYEESAIILCPVDGVEEIGKVVTKFDQEWYVREAVVYIRKDDNAEQERLRGLGFFELHPDEADPRETAGREPGSFAVFGRQELAMRYDNGEYGHDAAAAPAPEAAAKDALEGESAAAAEEDSIFRQPPAGGVGDEAPATLTSTAQPIVTTTSSSPRKKPKTTEQKD